MTEALTPKRSSVGVRDIARNDTFATVVVVVLLLGAMQIASRFLPPYLLPSPLSVLQAGEQLFTRDFNHVLITLARLAGALIFAVLVGVLYGFAMAMFAWARPYMRALIVIDTGIPALSWMLLAVLWFGAPELRIFFILSVILIPFYALNVFDGLQALPRDLIDMIDSFRPSRRQTLRYLLMPHIIPYVLLTTKGVVGYAIRMTIFAELIASAVGIGSRMSLAEATFHIDELIAWTFLLVVLNLGLQAAVAAAEKWLLKWRPEATIR
jgi:NitT/TauT family transport system permease protein